jgi:6-phosphofructokinase
MKRIGILTAGGDTPAISATIHGAVVRANQLKVEIFGLIKGFNSLFNPRVPHVRLNPLYQEIPEIDPTKGGTMIGSSHDYVDPNKKDELDLIVHRLRNLGIEGLICVGGPFGLQNKRNAKWAMAIVRRINRMIHKMRRARANTGVRLASFRHSHVC